ncbi:unnamed protein product, partial [marine sediment metagenome]
LYFDTSTYNTRITGFSWIPVVAPTVTTQAADGIGFDSPSAHATLHGTITDTGGENPGEMGFDYDYDSGPPYASAWTETNSYGIGPFSHQVTGFTEGVMVYFRAKAQNSAGWGYGGELSFKTPKAWTKTLTDSLGLLDATVKKDVTLHPLTETLGLVDTVIPIRQLVKVLTELLGMSDTVIKSPSVVKTEALGGDGRGNNWDP